MSIYHCICPGCGNTHIQLANFMSTNMIGDRHISKCSTCSMERIRASWEARCNGTFDDFRDKYWEVPFMPLQPELDFTDHTTVEDNNA